MSGIPHLRVKFPNISALVNCTSMWHRTSHCTARLTPKTSHFAPPFVFCVRYGILPSQNMIGNIYLIGGGEIANGETSVIDNEVKSLFPKNSSFVFFGSAASDAPGYIETIQKTFGDHFSVAAATKESGKELAQKLIQQASAIYLGGGVTENLLQLFDEWSLVKEIEKAAAGGKTIIGMSAGAQALAAWYVHEEKGGMEIRKGWGIVPVCCLVHASGDSFEKAVLLHQKNTQASSFPLVAIGEKAALRFFFDSQDNPQKIGGGKIWIKPLS